MKRWPAPATPPHDDNGAPPANPDEPGRHAMELATTSSKATVEPPKPKRRLPQPGSDAVKASGVGARPKVAPGRVVVEADVTAGNNNEYVHECLDVFFVAGGCGVSAETCLIYIVVFKYTSHAQELKQHRGDSTAVCRALMRRLVQRLPVSSVLRKMVRHCSMRWWAT